MSFNALVTGASRGTGYAIAERLHREGANVACLNRTGDGPDWMNVHPCDLADARDVRQACEQSLSDFGNRLDLCVLNAAQRILKPIEEMTEDEWETQVEVNLSSVFRIVKRVLPALKAARGTLFFVGSHAADHYFEGGGGYCSTKAGLCAFAEVASMEARQHGVRSIVLNPGAIRNRPGDNSPNKIAPEDVADLVWRLVNAGDSLIVGTVEIRPRSPVPSALQGIQRLQIL